MAELEKRSAAAPARETETPGGLEALPAQIGRLTERVATMLDLKMSLLKVEIKEDVNSYLRAGVMIFIGGIIAAVGFAILNVAVALFMGFVLPASLDPFVRFALGFVLTGVIYLIIGTIFIVSAKKRLAKANIVPERSVDELRKDKEWLEKEL